MNLCFAGFFLSANYFLILSNLIKLIILKIVQVKFF